MCAPASPPETGASKKFILFFFNKIFRKNISKSFELDYIAASYKENLDYLVNFEKILLMSNGQIVEEGNFSQLINQRGLFYAMSIENKFE